MSKASNRKTYASAATVSCDTRFVLSFGNDDGSVLSFSPSLRTEEAIAIAGARAKITIEVATMVAMVDITRIHPAK